MGDDWLSKDFVIAIKETKQEIEEIEEEKDLKNISLKFSAKMSRPSKLLISIELYEKLNKTKDLIPSYKNWSDISKLSNPYEKIHKIARSSSSSSSSSSSRSNKITRPGSRAFFKLCEILSYFEICLPFKNNSKVVSVHLCDAPGSFIQALQKEIKEVNKDITLEWFAQSLYVGSDALVIDKDVSDMSRWIKGGDESGNLYNIDNIIALRTFLLNKEPELADIITADGGFNTEFDPNNQEQLTLQLIYSEVVSALHLQKVGPNSTFICKIFDTVTGSTSSVLALLCYFYDNISIIKPRTSRYSNSEKYVVCIGFKGISEDSLKRLQNSVKKWSIAVEHGQPFCRDFNISIEPIQKILYDHNLKIISNQIKYIERSFEYSKLNIKQIHFIEALQNEKATDFCRSFNFTENDNISCKHNKLKNVSSNDLSLLNIKKCEMCKKLVV